jgi:RNA polymerase sigma-70 factor (ECF subfamily)
MELEIVVEELAPQLLRYALGRTGDPSLAEEVAQEALAALVLRWRRHGPPDCPAAFAFVIARRRAQRESLKRRLLFPLTVLFDRESAEPDPEERAASRTDLARMLAALKRLSARDREALLLVTVGELGHGEAARVLAISLSALKMRVHRARQRLQQLVEDPKEWNEWTDAKARETVSASD